MRDKALFPTEPNEEYKAARQALREKNQQEEPPEDDEPEQIIDWVY